MTPDLPIDAVRCAISQDDWNTASALLASHHHAVQHKLQCEPLSPDVLDQWQSLLAQQLGLLAELRVSRDETARRLRELSEQRRGMNAYLSGALG